MTSKPLPKSNHPKSSYRRESSPSKHRLDSLSIGIILLLLLFLVRWAGNFFSVNSNPDRFPPLVMSGGDPYIRALMRTISASESNGVNPYVLLYGGEQVQSLQQHPDRCLTILVGPNVGRCTTAAGRYQFLTTTWLEKARQYHPSSTGSSQVSDYSFLPEFQDRVVYAWLSDRRAWGADLSQLLRQGELDQVLRLLSSTWTSLGHGIESNLMTPHLHNIYQQMLAQEMAHANHKTSL